MGFVFGLVTLIYSVIEISYFAIILLAGISSCARCKLVKASSYLYVHLHTSARRQYPFGYCGSTLMAFSASFLASTKSPN